MAQGKKEFKHESLQDISSIKALIDAIHDGLEKGKLHFSDEDSEIILKPEGLLSVKVSASQDSNKERFSIRLSWQKEETGNQKKKHLKINS